MSCHEKMQPALEILKEVYKRFMLSPGLSFACMRTYLNPDKPNYEEALNTIRESRKFLRAVPPFPMHELPDTAFNLVLAYLGKEVAVVKITKGLDERVSRCLNTNNYWLSRMQIETGIKLNFEDFARYDAREIYSGKLTKTSRASGNHVIYSYLTESVSEYETIRTATEHGYLGALQFLAIRGCNFSDYVVSNSSLVFANVQLVEFLIEWGVKEHVLLELVLHSRKLSERCVAIAKFLIDRLWTCDSRRENVALLLATTEDITSIERLIPFLCGSTEDLIKYAGVANINSALVNVQFYGEVLALNALLKHRKSTHSSTQPFSIDDIVLKRGYVDILVALIDEGCGITEAASYGFCEDPGKFLSVVKTLDTNGLMTDTIVLNIYEHAVFYNNLEVIDYMVEEEYDCSDGIRLAIQNDLPEAMTLMLEPYLDVKENMKYYLSCALELGRHRQAKILIESLGEIKSGALARAITLSYYSTVKLLLKYVDPCLEDIKLSIDKCSSSITELLLRGKTWTDDDIYDCMSHAYSSHKCKHLEPLLRAKSSIDERDIEPLIWAAGLGRVDLVRNLMRGFRFSRDSIVKVLSCHLHALEYPQKSITMNSDLFDAMEILLEQVV